MGTESSDLFTAFVVRCASCGAPIAVEPWKKTSHCRYCGLDQITDPDLRKRLRDHANLVSAELECLDLELRKKAVARDPRVRLLNGVLVVVILGGMVFGTCGVAVFSRSVETTAVYWFGLYGALILAGGLGGILASSARAAVVAPKAPILRVLCRGCGAAVPVSSDSAQGTCPMCAQPMVADAEALAAGEALVDEAARRQAEGDRSARTSTS